MSYDLFQLKKVSRGKNVSFLTVVCNAVSKATPGKKQQGLVFQIHSSPHFPKRKWCSDFCRWQKEQTLNSLNNSFFNNFF